MDSRGVVLLFSLSLALQLGCAHRADPGAEARVAVINENMHELQSCWDEVSHEHPGAAGSLLFSLDVRSNGSVDWVAVDVDEIGSAKLIACTVRRIKHWRFPEDRKRRSLSFGVGFTSPS